VLIEPPVATRQLSLLPIMFFYTVEAVPLFKEIGVCSGFGVTWMLVIGDLKYRSCKTPEWNFMPDPLVITSEPVLILYCSLCLTVLVL